VSVAADFMPRFGHPIGPWHNWFAWYPVDTVDGGWAWLVIVKRRRCQFHSHIDGGLGWWWQYRRFV